MRCDPTSLVALALRGGEDETLDSRLRMSGMTGRASNVGNDREGTEHWEWQGEHRTSGMTGGAPNVGNDGEGTSCEGVRMKPRPRETRPYSHGFPITNVGNDKGGIECRE